MADLDHLMDGLDTLSSGLLSHTIIPLCKLADLLDHVKRKWIEHFNEYKLAMIEIHQYYEFTFIKDKYTDYMLVL